MAVATGSWSSQLPVVCPLPGPLPLTKTQSAGRLYSRQPLPDGLVIPFLGLQGSSSTLHVLHALHVKQEAQYSHS
jgi:hypothetical protein